MDKEYLLNKLKYLLYKLRTDKTYFQNFLNLIELQNNISYPGVTGTELNYIGGDIKLITDSLYYVIENRKHVENYDINTCETVLINLLSSGKLSVRSTTEIDSTIEYLNNILNPLSNVNFPTKIVRKENNSWVFLKFMLGNSFNPENYNNILELAQSVPNSLSQYLTNDKQFLLSKMVSYTDLETHYIRGAKGYIDANEGIVVPKSSEADAYFRNHQEMTHNEQTPRYVYPTITDFDSIISYYDWTTITNSNLLKEITPSIFFPFKNYYIGFIANKDDKYLSEKVSIFLDILEVINKHSSQKHTLVHDTISDKNKEFYLIKK